MRSPRERLLTTTALTMALLVALRPGAAWANPQGGVVSAGQATITQSGNTVDINQRSNRAVIDWRGFDIAPGETTQFNQPSSSAIALNRVNSTSPSTIDGNLMANGNIVIVNQNGVLFGQGAKVDVNSLVATTANITNDAFMNATGPLTFNLPGNPSASVVNDGTITAAQAGLVGLVAPSVLNNGVITAKLGRVQLGSGDTATIDLYGDGLMQVAVSNQVQSQLIANNGTIEADGGKVQLAAAAASGIVNSLITVPGDIEAPTVSQKNGEIDIDAEGSNAVPDNVAADKGQKQGSSTVEVGGTLNASGYGSGQTGGNISVLADDVGILSGSLIDASGDAGGGTIKIGGDFHGAGDTPTASATVVERGNSIFANAVEQGNGGNVAVWADDYTNYAGNIEARGGANGGNGGYVETSGKIDLQMSGLVDASAARGNAGTWLLDPEDVTISTGADSDESGNPSFVPGGTQATAVINTTDIDTALNAGTNVTVTTSNNAQAGPNGGSITVASAISATGGGTGLTTTGSLTLASYKDIVVNSGATITLGGGTNTSSQTVTGGAVTLDSANSGNSIGAISVAGNISTNGGNITLGGNEAIPGNIVAGTGYAVGDAAHNIGVSLGAATLSANGGDIIINGTGWSNAGTNQLIGVYSSASTIATTANGSISINGAGGTGGQNFAYGVNIDNGNTISVQNNNLTISGTGGAAGAGGAQNIGVLIDGTSAALASTGSGTITINGTGGSGPGGFNNNYGVVLGLFSGAQITSSSGNISINGTGTVNAANNSAILLTHATIQSTGSANITLQAQSPRLADAIHSAAGTASAIGGASDTGSITFISDSISFGTATPSVTTTGTVTYQPYSAATSIGVAGGPGTLQITSGAGGILTNTTAGTIAIGSAADTNTLTADAYNWSSNVDFISGSGGITIGGAQALGSNNFTLQSDATPTFSSTVTTTGNALLEPASAGTTIAVAGTGQTLNITSGILGDITAGSITIGNTADTGPMTVNAYTWSNPLSLVSGSGVITISGAQALGSNNFTLDTNDTPTFSSTVTTTGGITVETPGNTFGVGTNASGAVNLTDTMIGDLSAGSYTFGSTSTGAVDINTGSSIANKNLTFISGSTIYLDKSGDSSPTPLTDSGSSTTTLTMQAGTDIVTAGAINASGTGALNVLMDSDTANGGGAISTGGNITSNGGNITLGGGEATPSNIVAGTGFAVGDATYKVGVDLLTSANLTAGGGNIVINGDGYTGGTNTSNAYGVALEGSNVVSTLGAGTSGTITLTGTGGGSGSGSLSYGDSIQGQIKAVNGAITINGTGGSVGVENIGVSIGSNISASGSGNITIDGTGGNTSGGADQGVNIEGPTISTASGNISITANGVGTGSGNAGAYFYRTTLNSGSGTTTITGTSNNSLGIQFDSSGVSNVITSTGSGDTITGTGTTGLYFAAAALQATGTASLTVQTDSLSLNGANAINAGSNAVIIVPKTASTAVNVATGSTGLRITSGMLGDITAGNLTIGNTSDTGPMTVGAYSSWAAPVSFITGSSGSITVAGAQSGNNTFSFTGPTTLGGNITSTGSGTGITFNSAVTLGDNDTVTTSNGAVDFASTVNGAHSLTANSGSGGTTFAGKIGGTMPLASLSLTGDSLTFGDKLYGTGTLTIQPSTASTNLHINDGTSSGLYLTSAEQGYIQNDWSSVLVGSTSDTASMTVGATTWNNPLLLRAGSGGITIAGAQTMGGNSITFTGATALDAGIITNNAAGTFNSAVTLGANDTINLGNGTLNFGNSVNGGHNLTATAGTFSFASAWGGSTPLSAVSLTSTNGLTLPSISAASIFTQTTGSSSDITIGSGATLTSSGNNTAITLASGRNFIDDNNSDALSASNGRWLIYSANPARDTLDGLGVNFRVFGCTFGDSCSSLPATGNGAIYSYSSLMIPNPVAVASAYMPDLHPPALSFLLTPQGFIAPQPTNLLTIDSSLQLPGSDNPPYALPSPFESSPAAGSDEDQQPRALRKRLPGNPAPEAAIQPDAVDMSL